MDQTALVEIAGFLRPADFYRQAHATLYATMVGLFEARKPVDIVTLSEALERDGTLAQVGGRAFLANLSSVTPTAVHVVQYARIVEQKAVYRNMISAAGKIAAIGFDEPEDLQEAIDRAETELFNVSNYKTGSDVVAIQPLLHGAYDQLEHLYKHRGTLSGIGSGFVDLDQLTTGFQKGDLTIVAARPSVGKTSLALNITEHAALKEHKTVCIFSLEMSREQLVMRLISSVADVDSRRLRTGEMDVTDWAKVGIATNTLSEAPILIDDSATMASVGLRTKARRVQAESGLDLVIVDYLQLMHSPAKEGGRVQEVSEISRGLKALARELNVPVIALSQLSRRPEERSDNEPKLSDLRDSGAIEQDADLVIFLYREKDIPFAPGGDLVNVKLAKHRNGPIGDFKLLFRSDRTRFKTQPK